MNSKLARELAREIIRSKPVSPLTERDIWTKAHWIFRSWLVRYYGCLRRSSSRES